MDARSGPLETVKRWCRRVAGYFAAARDPAAGRRARVVSAMKGLAATGASALVLLVAYAIILIPFTPSISDIRKAKVDQPSVLMSADGKRLADYSKLNREWIELKRVSAHAIDALIATEDHRFYDHHGVDARRLVAAAVYTALGRTQGGSTITQQLARNLYPEEIGRKRSLTRKIRELIIALKIEHAYTKQEILETYLNTMPFLYNAFGIEMAARTYFDKPASRLDVLESATLIGMLKGAGYYNPVLNPERALRRRNVVLSQMLKRGVISQAEFDSLKSRPIRLDFERQTQPPGAAPHFAEHVRRWLVEWADRNDYSIESDGLVVHTTIDSRLQAAANQAVTRQMEALQAVADVEWGQSSGRLISTSTAPYVSMRRRVEPFAHFWSAKESLVDTFVRESQAFRSAVDGGAAPEAALAKLKSDPAFMTRLRAEKTRLESGFVAIDPLTGEVKAWVGSRDFKTDQFDHVAKAQRQAGSTFKPFLYAAALEQGMSPEQRFTDQAVEITLRDGTVWRPTDLSAPSGAEMTVREGLIHSKNTITAQIMQQVGAQRTAELARRMGVSHSKLDPVPSLALGTSAVTPLEMVSGYSTIAAGGEYRAPIFVRRISDQKGNVLAEFAPARERVLSRATSEELIGMMRGVVNEGTGQAVRARFGLQADVAGKTGTTQNNADGWFILMHPRLVAGSWVGFNDPRVTMRSNYWGQGAHNALLVVGDFFRQALNAKLIDGSARFPRTRDPFLGPLVDQVEEWLGIKRPDSGAPAPPRRKGEPGDSVLHDWEDMVEEGREAARSFERERRRLGEAIEKAREALDRWLGNEEPQDKNRGAGRSGG